MTTTHLLLSLAALLGWGLIVGVTSALATVYLTRRRPADTRPARRTGRAGVPARAHRTPAHPEPATKAFEIGRQPIAVSPEVARRNREAA
jgi:hypothetical protein